MSDKEKPLPKPPGTPFGRKRNFEQGDKQEPLMADRMAMSMAEGKLEDFIQRELPDNDSARKLAEMMMGMTGMLPPEGFSEKSSPKKEIPPEKRGKAKAKSEEKPPSMHPPEDVINAAKEADVEGLVELLKREQKKLSPESETDTPAKEKTDSADTPNPAAIEKEVIVQLMKIASDNNLTLDWIFFRALKKFVQDYQKTGNL
ncbi:MAG: hypothetical protein ABFR82_09600 [Nitrospirota bacterium]